MTMPQRPNEAGETPVIVRWMVETPAGWLGAYNREAFDAYAAQRVAPLVEALERQVANIDLWLTTGVPAGPEESKSIYDQMKAALAAEQEHSNG